MCDILNVGRWVCGMFGLWEVRDVECLGCAIFGMWEVRNVECLEFGMFRDVECLGCGVWDVGCGMFPGIWNVGLQNA